MRKLPRLPLTLLAGVMLLLAASFGLAAAAALRAGAAPDAAALYADETATAAPHATLTPHHAASATPEPHESSTPHATATAHSAASATLPPHDTATPHATAPPHDDATATPHATLTQQPHESSTPHASATAHPQQTATHESHATSTPTHHAEHGLVLAPHIDYDHVQPGASLSYQYLLSNSGAGTLQVTLAVSSELGWTASVEPPSLALPAGGSAAITLRVQVPAVPGGAADHLIIKASSGDHSTLAHAVLLVEQHSFSDLAVGDWAYEPVQLLVARGALSGYGDGTFRPGAAVTRAQFAKMLAAGMGWQLVSPAAGSFSDVPAGHWAYSYVETARLRGVLAGYGDGSFRPGANITRGQMVKMIVTARQWRLREPTAGFSDVGAADWSAPFVATAVDAAIVSGYSDGTFRPNAPATRAQAAKILAGGLIAGQDE